MNNLPTQFTSCHSLGRSGPQVFLFVFIFLSPYPAFISSLLSSPKVGRRLKRNRFRASATRVTAPSESISIQSDSPTRLYRYTHTHTHTHTHWLIADSDWASRSGRQPPPRFDRSPTTRFVVDAIARNNFRPVRQSAAKTADATLHLIESDLAVNQRRLRSITSELFFGRPATPRPGRFECGLKVIPGKANSRRLASDLYRLDRTRFDDK